MAAPLLIALTAQLAFLLYLLLAGAGVGRALRICLMAAVAGCGATLAVSLFLPVVFLDARLVMGLAVLFNLLTLPTVVFAKARDLVIQRTSVVEVMLINVLVLMTAGGSTSLGYLLNPLSLVVPMGFWWTAIIGLWPTALAVLLTWQGPPGDLRLRMILGIWAQLVGIVWLLPTAFYAVQTFDATSPGTYLESVLASLAGVYVVMSAVHLFWLFGGSHGGETQRFGNLAVQTGESVVVTRMHPLVLLGVGLLGAAILGYGLTVRPTADAPLLIFGMYSAAGVFSQLLTRDAGGDTSRIAPQRRWTVAPTAAEKRERRRWMAWVHITGAESDELSRSWGWRLWLAAIGVLLLYVFSFLSASASAADALLLPIMKAVAALAVLPLVFATVWTIIESIRGLPTPRKQQHWVRFVGVAAVIAGGAIAVVRSHERLDHPWGPQGPPPTAKDSVAQIKPEQSPCVPVGAVRPALLCGDVAATLGELPHLREVTVPTAWQIENASYYRLQTEHHDVLCIEIPATARLADGKPDMAVAIVFAEMRAARNRRYWLTDREGSCRRLAWTSTDLIYEWHPTISAYVGQSRSALWVN